MHSSTLLCAFLLCLAHAVFGQWSVSNNNRTVLTFTYTNGSLTNLFDDQLFTGSDGFVEVLFFSNEGNGVTLQFKHRLLLIVEIPAGSQYNASTTVLSSFTIAAWNGFVGSLQNADFVSTSNDPIGIYDVTVIPDLSSSFYTVPANTTFDFQVPKSAQTSRIGFLTLASVAEVYNGNYISTSLSFTDVLTAMGPGCFTFLNQTIPVTLTGSTLLTTSPTKSWNLYWTVEQDFVGNFTNLFGLQLSSFVPQAPIVVPPPSPATTGQVPPPPATTGQVPPPATTGQVPPPATTGQVPPPATTGQVPPPSTTGQVPPPSTTGQVPPPVPICPATGQTFTTQEVQQSEGSLTSILSPILMILCSAVYFMH